MAELKATPRGEILGLIADALLGAKAKTGVVGDFLLGDAPELVDDLSYGVKPWRGKGQATVVNPAVLDAAGLLPVGGAVGLAGKFTRGAEGALGTAQKTSQLGALRPGGREDLIPSHGTSVRGLLGVLGKKRGELLSPSIGITKDELANNFAEGALLIPKEGAFDPATYNSVLFNRDVWTPRVGDFSSPEVSSRGRTVEAPARLKDRFIADKKLLRGTESTNFQSRAEALTTTELADRLSSTSRAISMKSSPMFNSFKHFEESPTGAALLNSDPINSYAYGNELIQKSFSPDLIAALEGVAGRGGSGSMQDMLEQLAYYTRVAPKELNFKDKIKSSLAKVYSDSDESAKEFEVVRRAMERNPEFAAKFAAGVSSYTKGLQKAPSEYAELKVLGPTQIGSENWAGAILNPAYGGAEDLAEILQGKGLRVEMGSTFDPVYAAEAARYLQELAGPARRAR